MGRQDVPLWEVIVGDGGWGVGGDGGVSLQAQKFEFSSSIGYQPPTHPNQKINFPIPFLMIDHTLEKMVYHKLLDKFYLKFCLRCAFSVTQS